MEGPPNSGWKATVARIAYNAACAVATPATLPLLAIHPRLSGAFWQRLALEAPAPRRALWLHGSSAGDVAALLPLARRLERQGAVVALSAWTRSGHDMAARRGGDAVAFRAPLDLPGPVETTLDRLAPRCLVLECLEMWPHLVSACHARGVPVAVVNGRLSESSLAAYRRLRWLFEPCFAGLSLVTALTEADARRFVVAGARRSRVHVLSSSKHGDARPPALAGPLPRLVLGSLHRAEEELIFPCLPRLLARAPGVQLVVAPRYPHRAASVRRALERRGLRASMLSAGTASGGVVVVDTMGQLADQYNGARVAFVGGSLIPHGGHNVVEAAARGAPVLVGPHTRHCAREVELLREAGGAEVVEDGARLCRQALLLLEDDARYAAARDAGLSVAAALAGAADEVARLVLALLERS